MRDWVGAARLGVLAVAAGVLAACDEPAWLTDRDPLPPLAEWVRPLLGRQLEAAFSQAPADACAGSVDVVEQRFGGDRPGAQISGWGWDQTAKAPFARIIVVDSRGRIAGGGESGRERLDVPEARKEVTSPLTGWVALTGEREGEVLGYGILADGAHVCRLGGIAL